VTLYALKSVLAAKIETTVGTPISLSASDAAFNVFNAKIFASFEMVERELQGGFDRGAAVTAGHKGRMTFSTEIQWDGTTTEPSWADTLFPACGWVKSGQVFTPRSEAPGSNVKTLTIGRYVDGMYYQLSGCAGSFTVNLTAGQRGMIDWDFSGVWSTPTDVALITPTLPTSLVQLWSKGACSWNSVDFYALNAQIQSGNTIAYRPQPGTSTGFHSAIIVDRYPKVTLDPERKLVATQDRWGKWLTGAEHALAVHVGGVVGNSTTALLQFDAPKAQVMQIDDEERDRIAVDAMTFGCNKNGSTQDQSLSITFTAAT